MEYEIETENVEREDKKEEKMPWKSHFYRTLPLFGIQFAWAFEFSYGTPLLLSLGMSPSLTALVWLAGPLSGLLIQPLTGCFSDNHRSKFGKRIPFVILGTTLTVSALLIILFSKSIPTMAVAGTLMGFYLLDVSLNITTTAIRSNITDVTPMEFQTEVNAWATRMIGAGNIIGYFVAILDLGNQISTMIIITILTVIPTSITTCLPEMYEKEEIEENEEPDNVSSSVNLTWKVHFSDSLKQLLNAARTIQQNEKLITIFTVQFFSWIAWFPILFYNSTWIARIIESTECSVKECTFDEIIRKASWGMLFLSIVSFISSFAIPFYVSWRKVKIDGRTSEFLLESESREQENVKLVEKLLKVLWCLSGSLFAVVSIITFFWINTFIFAVLAMGFFGISWAISTWIPFVLIANFIQKYKSDSAGIYIGLSNIFVVLPQFLAVGLCSLLFYFSQDIQNIFVFTSIFSAISACMVFLS